MVVIVARGTTGRKAQKDQEEIRKRMEEMECHKADTTGLDLFCRVPSTLGKEPFALGKGFAKCGTRQTGHETKSDGEEGFAECLFSDTRQRVCRV